jgi:hypothetical protein
VRTCATFTAGPALLSGAKRATGGPFTIEMILGNGLAGPKLSGGPYDVTVENLGGAP